MSVCRRHSDGAWVVLSRFGRAWFAVARNLQTKPRPRGTKVPAWFRKTRQSLISTHRHRKIPPASPPTLHDAFLAAGSRYFCTSRELDPNLQVNITCITEIQVLLLKMHIASMIASNVQGSRLGVEQFC